MMASKHRFIALGSRLKGVPEVTTLGVRPNFMDYSASEREWILQAEIVFYPTLNYAQFLNTLGRCIFPSLETYLYADDKIKQTTLFYMLGIPHPRTRFYYHLHFDRIAEDFACPFISKLARRSAKGKGVFKIQDAGDLKAYLNMTDVAYIQEHLPHERDLRVILINYRPILAYWRIRQEGNYRTNLAQGGRVDFENIPAEGIRLAEETARRCRLNDVGLDLIHSEGKWYVIEANMKYGRKALEMKGRHIKDILRQKLLSGEISPKTLNPVPPVQDFHRPSRT